MSLLEDTIEILCQQSGITIRDRELLELQQPVVVQAWAQWVSEEFTSNNRNLLTEVQGELLHVWATHYSPFNCHPPDDDSDSPEFYAGPPLGHAGRTRILNERTSGEIFADCDHEKTETVTALEYGERITAEQCLECGWLDPRKP